MRNKKLVFLAVFLLAATIVLSGCKTASEKAAEKIIEKATNGQADVDIGTNTVRINTNTGSYQAGGNVAVPSGFPSDVYRIDGTLTSAQTTSQANGYILTIETTKSLTEAKNLYDQHLANDGWTVTSSMSYQDTVAIFADKGNRIASIGINVTDGKNIVVIQTYTNTSTNTATDDNSNN